MQASSFRAKHVADQSGKTIVITGANSGLGFRAARWLAGRGGEVIMACRSEERADAARKTIKEEVFNANLEILPLDLSSLVSVETALGKLKGKRVDVLINNAGVMIPPLSRTQEGFELQMGVNHLGHFALTLGLLPSLALAPEARVVNVSSLAHRQGKLDLDDLHWQTKPYKKWAAYGQSKLANLLFTKELDMRLAKASLSIKAVASHPGYTATELQKHMAIAGFGNSFLAMKPDQGVLPTLYAATADVDRNSYWGPDGLFELRGYTGPAKRSRAAQDPSLAAALFEKSEEDVGATWNDCLQRVAGSVGSKIQGTQ